MGNKPYDGNRLKYSNTISGGGIDWLLNAGFLSKEIIQYIYPSDDEMSKANLRIVFMDYFMKDFNMLTNGNYSALRGLSIRKVNLRSDPDLYGTSLLDEDFINVNMYIRYLKFGFGRANDILNNQIRDGIISRAAAAKLVDKYDGSFDRQIVSDFCDFIGITVKTFWETVDPYVNNELFTKHGLGNYEPKFKAGISL